MGRLKDLWSELKSLDREDPKRKVLQAEINKIEKFCISKGYEGFAVTMWHDGNSSPRYPFNNGAIWYDDIWQMAEFNRKGLNYNNDGSIHVDDK